MLYEGQFLVLYFVGEQLPIHHQIKAGNPSRYLCNKAFLRSKPPAFSRSAHTRFYHSFHVVWITKYRNKVLRGAMRERILEMIIRTRNEMGVDIVRGVLAREHVHMFLSIPPKLTLSDVMQRIKGRSSHRIQMEFSELRKR